MKAAKVGLLFLILGAGGALEAAWTVHSQLAIGPAGCKVLGGRFYGSSFSFQAEEVKDVPAGATLEVQNAFGAVRVTRGAPQRVRIVLRKVVYRPTEADARAFADRIQLQTALQGQALHVGTNREPLVESSEGRDVGFETHLEIEVPPDTRVTVANEHGEISVEDVATADLSGSFESMRASRVSGDTTLKNRHGDTTAESIGGTLTVSSRHGDISAHGVKGALTVDHEHGDVTVVDVAGLHATLAHADLNATDVAGDLEVTGDHVGVEATRVAGHAVLQTSFRDVALRDVGAEAKVRLEHAGFQAHGVKGGLTVDARFGDVEAEDVGGPLDVTVTHGGFQARRLQQGGKVRASGDDVEIEGFRGPLDVIAERGGIRVVATSALTDAVSLEAKTAGIELSVPADSAFDLEASAASGEVRVSLPGFTASETSPARVVGRVAGGGKLVRLKAERGDVELETSGVVAERRHQRHQR